VARQDRGGRFSSDPESAIENPTSKWLPSIRNINFRLLSEDEAHTMAETGVYFFQPANLKKKTKTYEIGFGFGDPRCWSDGTG